MAKAKSDKFQFEPTSDKHYEEKFEFPFWKLIKQRAEEKDISYSAATIECIPEYQKKIRYLDEQWADAQIRKRHEEQRELIELNKKEKKDALRRCEK